MRACRFPAAGAFLALAASTATSSAQSIEILSRTTGGGSPNGPCEGAPVLSSDGRHVVFRTSATNLAPGLGDGIVALDRFTQTFERVSVGTGGVGYWSAPEVGGVSDDGRYVTFLSTNYIPQGGNDYGPDILVRDRVANTTIELSGFEFEGLPKSVPQLTADGQHVCWSESNTWHPGSYSFSILVKTRTGASVAVLSAGASAPVDRPKLAAGGRYVAHAQGDPNGTHLKRWDYVAGTSVTIVSALTDPGVSVAPLAISRDGRFVAYSKLTGQGYEIWLHDVQTVSDERVDTPTSNVGFAIRAASISDDGRYVLWSSASSAYVAGDTNQAYDVFARDRVGQVTARVSVAASGAQANGGNEYFALDQAGGAVVFLSDATNLGPIDGNSFADLYRRSLCTSTYADLDSDGYGAGSALYSCAPPPANHVSIAGDCDDADPARHPNATEACNGVDDDCDSLLDEDIAGVVYCAGDGSATACPCGNAGALGNGCASLAADTLVLVGSGLSNSFALYFQGDTQANGGAGIAFGDGLRCVSGTVVRLGSVPSVGGSSRYPDVGAPSISVRGSVAAPGVRAYQCWYRSAAAYCTSATFNLTNGMSIAWAP